MQTKAFSSFPERNRDLQSIVSFRKAFRMFTVIQAVLTLESRLSNSATGSSSESVTSEKE